MTLDRNAPGVPAALERLTPYVLEMVTRAGERARSLFADTVTVEHVIVVALEDEECAAYDVVEHAFADPESLAIEALALAPGLMVVGSKAALPFSTHAVEALERARGEAALSGATAVDIQRLLEHGRVALPAEIRADLGEAAADLGEAAATQGTAPKSAEPGPPTDSDTTSVQPDGPLFKYFSTRAKQALSLACRLAKQAGLTSIGPVQLVLACLRTAPELESGGWTASRLRAASSGREGDETPPPERLLPADSDLLAFLGSLPTGGSSLELLARCHAGPTPELGALLARHKVSAALLERSREAFEDPEV